MRKLLLLFPVLLWSLHTFGQIQVSVTIESGFATTTCTDFFGGADPLWSVNINNQGPVVYPETGNCFTSLPNIQYQANYNCEADVPATVEICFTAFENDALGFELGIDCSTDNNCSETICQDYPIPVTNWNATYTLQLPDNLASDGELTFTISNLATAPIVTNDTICSALDLGVLDYGTTIGDATQGLYSNICASNVGDPQPSDEGFFFNQAGVWFSFTTGPDISGEFFINAVNDPEALGFDIDLQVAVYTSDTDDCLGNLTLVSAFWPDVDNNVWMPIECPMPNTTYYVLIDGAAPLATTGVFGLEIIDIGVMEGGDLRCDYEDLGEVPEGGFVETADWVSNFCSTDSDDPYVQAFVSQHSVWFGFIAPPSGHVLIEGITDRTIDSIGVQLALYQSFNTFCNGPFGHVMSQYDDDDLDQSMIATCLYPGRSYWILVDGTGFNAKGIFKIRVTDNGDITPKVTVDTTVCAGTEYQVGSSIYTEPGNYADTIQLFAGCDSIVFTNLTFLDSLAVLSIDQTPAIGMTATGIATATVTGGTSNYSYLWCNGETTQTATTLVGGDNCCVTITDDIGCEIIECFDVEFLTGIIPVFENDSLNCFGETNGIIRFTTLNGEPPYNFSWTQSSSGLNGSGTIDSEGDETFIENLHGGAVEITINDAFFDTTFVASVFEPEALILDSESVTEVSCFGFCDGSIDVVTIGGTGNRTFLWSNGANTEDISGLCTGTYELTVTDENGCELITSFFVNEPLEFIASPVPIQNVSCFEGDDGHAGVLLQNGTAAEYSWINGETTPEINGLSAGFYDVTVTNTDGCEAYTSVEITQPSAPLEVDIDVLTEISCFGESDGALEAQVSGPWNSLNYNWSSGVQTPVANNLGAGMYQLNIVNENGCEAFAEFTLQQPAELIAQISAKDITCLDPANGGEIYIDTVYGGMPGYLFSLDGENFSSFQTFTGLEEGNYEILVQDVSGCELALDISVLGPPDLFVDLGDDFEISLGETATITAISNSTNLNYSWNYADTSQTDEIIVTPYVSTLYSVAVFDTITQCSAEDAVFVWINKDRNIFVPNAFSPNNDGVNDDFGIYSGFGIESIKSFRVFSRAGDLLHERLNAMPNDPFNHWDGKFQGQTLNPGVFVYVAEIEFVDGITEIFKGEVILVK
jgi:gliding motility-associated-like protein